MVERDVTRFLSKGKNKFVSKAMRAVLACSLLLLGPQLQSAVPLANAATPVTITKHADLGFTSTMPISTDSGVADPPCLFTVISCVFHGAYAFNGTMTVSGTIGQEIAMTYNPSDLNSLGGSLPISVKYTPTPGGSTASYSLSGNMTLNFDGCTNCPAILPVSGSSSPVSFTAPMDSDAPINIPGSSTPITLKVGNTPIISASIGSTLTLAPAPPGLLPGLGGGAAIVTSSGATGAPLLPLEWDTPGSFQNFTLTNPSSPSAISISLSPVMHWVSTSGDAKVNLHWSDDFQTIAHVAIDLVVPLVPVPFPPFALPYCEAGSVYNYDCKISDPSPISLFTGGLGPVYTSAGLNTTVANAIGGTAGSLVAGRIANGFVPIPLTSPPLANIPPITIGSVQFDIPMVSIAGAPGQEMLSGNPINLTANSSGGNGPLSYQWTKDGAAFGNTASINDIPSLGNTTYAVTVIDSLGAVSNTAAVTVEVYDFAVNGNPTSLKTLTTGSNAFNVSETLLPGSVSTSLPAIGLSVTGLPSGASPIFAPVSGNAIGFNSTLTISTSNAASGNYSLTLVGSDSRPSIGGNRTTTLSLTVLTSSQALQTLIVPQINSLHANGALNGGQTNALLTKVNHAISALASSSPPNVAACGELNAFVNNVHAFVSAGILTQAQADSLLDGPLGVLSIMASVPC